MQSIIAAIVFMAFASPGAAAGNSLASPPPRAEGAAPSQTYQPVVFTFGYGGLVDTYVTALYIDDVMYLPIHVLFNDLKIDNRLDMRGESIRGFFIDESRKYEIDFGNTTASVGGRKFRIDSTDFIRGQVDYYVVPSFFKKIFGLDFSLDMGRLTIVLHTDLKLPVISDYERRVDMQYQTQPLGIFRPEAPLRYGRDWSILNGGVLDYSLGSFYSGTIPSYSFNLDGGAELLGGDVEGTLSGEIVGKRSTIYNDELHWRYVIDSTRAISSFSVGNLYSNGVYQYDFRGVQISNQPVQLRRFFGSYAFMNRVQPGWETELFLNGERVGYQKADASGNVHYDIPLVYGSSFLQLKTFGPSGEYREIDRRFQVPFTLIPKGEFDYSVNAGKLTTSNSNLVQLNASYGVTGWLTDEVGADYLQSPEFNRPVPYNSLTMRLSSPYIFTLKTAPMMLYETSLNAVYPSQASFDLIFDRYASNKVYNASDRLDQLAATAYFPFYFGANSFDLNFAGNGQDFEDGSRTVAYSAGVNASLARFNISANYTGSYQAYALQTPLIGRTISGSLLYSFFTGSGVLSFLNGALAGLNADYDLQTRSITTVRFDASQYIGDAVSVQFSVNGDLLNRNTSMNLQITCDLPWIQVSSSTSYQGPQRNSDEFMSGSIGFDSHYDKFLFNRIQWAGQSAVSMRMYLDNNEDGKFDKGDQVITDGDIVLRQAVSSNLFTSGVIRAWDLLPYSRYSADIQSGSLRNPLWMPVRKSFSFISDPNVYKPIDIPFYTAGVLEGSVRRIEQGKKRAVPGIDVIVEATHGLYRKTISAFNDGSLYYVGIPPGKYRIYVDPSQVAALGVRSTPGHIDFTVKSKRAGDFVKGLNFVLVEPDTHRTTVSGYIGVTASIVGANAPKPPSIKEMRYLIQLGAFATESWARRFAIGVHSKIQLPVHVVYNPKSRLYSVQLDTIRESEKAYRLEQELIYDHGIRDAFVLVLPANNIIYDFSARLGVFRSLDAALRLRSEAQRILRVKTRIDFNSPLRKFQVMAGDFDRETRCNEFLRRLRRRRAYRRADLVVTGRYVIPRYAVLLDAFGSYESAERYAKDNFDRRNLDALIDFNPTTLRFEVYTTPTPYESEAQSMRARLERKGISGSLKVIRVN